MDNNKLLRTALILSFITIVYNVAEGVVSVFFGAEDDALSLLGFGIDSFVEVISGLGIAHMVMRMRYGKIEQRDKFERTALRITGTGFYLLTVGLIAGAVVSMVQGHKPETTMPGIIISSLSIATMWFLLQAKLKVGKALNSDAIIADANCTRSCFYLSVILLTASGLYEWLQIGYIDIIGALAIAWFAFSEGRESFQKAKSQNLSCCCSGECE